MLLSADGWRRGKEESSNFSTLILNWIHRSWALFLLRLFHKRLNGLLIDTQKTARLYLARTNFWIHLRFTREKIAFVSSMPRSTSSSDNMFPSGEHELVCKVSRLDAFTDPRWLVEEGEHKKALVECTRLEVYVKGEVATILGQKHLSTCALAELGSVEKCRILFSFFTVEWEMQQFGASQLLHVSWKESRERESKSRHDNELFLAVVKCVSETRKSGDMLLLTL